MKNFSIIKSMSVFIILIFYLIISCASHTGKYVLSSYPSENINSFKIVEVAKVELGETKDELDPEIPNVFQLAIWSEIQKTAIFDTVSFGEFDKEERTIRIECKIIEFDEGSDVARILIGGGAGKAFLDVSCKFINKRTKKVFAEGIFKGIIRGDFSAAAIQAILALDVAESIVEFIKLENATRKK